MMIEYDHDCCLAPGQLYRTRDRCWIMFPARESITRANCNYLVTEFTHVVTAPMHANILSGILACDVSFLLADSLFMVIETSEDGFVMVIDQNGECGWNHVPSVAVIGRELIPLTPIPSHAKVQT